MNKLGLYIHIPFCRRKCAYCNFYSLGGRESDMTRYKEALTAQIGALSSLCADRTVDTVYFGGGTPSIFGLSDFGAVMNAIFTHFHIDPHVEITIEANPATVTEESLGAYADMGVNRISFGVQSADDGLLHRIGRLHTFDEAKASILASVGAGFDNVSADLIYGLPGQTLSGFLDDLEKVCALPIRHLSVYGLKVEENTPFGRDKTLVLPDEEEQCAMYLQGVERLARKGFCRYEISNFAIPGYESRHNLKYWRREEYLGFGPAAHSFFDGARFAVKSDLDAYLAERDFSLDADIYTDRRVIEGREALEEKVMLSLRTYDGVPVGFLESVVGDRERLYRYLSLLYENRYAEKGPVLRLTPKGMLISNSIISDILTI